MATKILRITRHSITPEQEKALRRAFGEISVHEHTESLPGNPQEAVPVFDELADGYDVVEAVLPINLLSAIMGRSQFAKRGGRIIRAVMQREMGPDGQAVFKFDHYEIVREVRIVTEPLL